ncbi:MAG: N-acetyltransferase [Chitinophagaceae bacterium]
MFGINYTGRGIARAMVMECVQYAGENHLKIVPMCSYVRYVLEGDEALGDVMG